MSNKPQIKIHSQLSYGLEIAVWVNEKGNCSYKITKTYKDKETGNRLESKYLSNQDMMAIYSHLPGIFAEVQHLTAHNLVEKSQAQEEENSSHREQPIIEEDIPF